ncbi:MAG TPA: S9 family peptidase [Thermoanaerobaculia bacterium]|nr:S9 family peptidase [Thermoanaerobaculia bacterium]
MRALAFLLLTVSTVAAKPVTVDDLMKLRSIVDVRIAPDGKHVAYVVSTPSVTKNEHEVALFVAGIDGGEAKRVGETVRILNTPLPAPRLRWTADSTSIALLGIAGDKPQVFAVPIAGGEVRQLTEAGEGVFGFELSPDGKSIAYLTRDPMPAERPVAIRADAPDRPARLVVRPLGGTPVTLTPLTHFVDAMSWSPDSRELAYSAASRGGFPAQYYTRVYAIAASGGEPRAIVDRAGMNTRPQFSPDGTRIAFISTNGRNEIMAPRSLTVVSSKGGAPRLYLMNDAWVNELAWAHDSKSVFVTTNDGTFASKERMFDQPIVRVRVADGHAERVAPGVDFSLSISRDGRRLVYRGVESRTMGDVFVLDTQSGRATKITNVNPELNDFDLGTLSVVKWQSFDDMEIYGLLLSPLSPPAGRGWRAAPGEGRLPLLVYIHGGPGGGVTHGLFPQFMHNVSQIDPYPVEAFASAGYAVLFPMPRGGAGYGEAGQRAIVNAWGEADYRDIMAGVDEMIRRGLADPDRLGVMGASYGGYMTNWVVTQTNRFKAASAGASISDLTDPFYLTDGGQFMEEYFGKPWKNRAAYEAHSPLTFAERVTTPLLIQHGERDNRVPIAGAWKFYRALKAMGKTVELDIYPRGGHVMYEPVLQREVMRRNFEWFTRWIPVK